MLLLFALVACGDNTVRSDEPPTRVPFHGQVVAGAGRLRAGAITVHVEVGAAFSSVRGGR